MAPKTGLMKQARARHDEQPVTGPGDGDIIPLMAGVGLLAVGLTYVSTGFTLMDTIIIAVLWYGALAAFGLVTKEQTIKIMESKEVDEYGSSGSALRWLGNMGIALLVVGSVTGFAVLTGWAG